VVNGLVESDTKIKSKRGKRIGKVIYVFVELVINSEAEESGRKVVNCTVEVFSKSKVSNRGINVRNCSDIPEVVWLVVLAL
jgi:hypothetical protein